MSIAHNPLGSKMLSGKNILAKRSRFWWLQSGGWLLFGFIDLYASSQMTGPVPMSGRHVFTWAASLLTGFCISLILWPIYRITYRKNKSILSYVLVSVLSTLTGSFLWLTIKDLIERAIQLGMPYSIWSQSHASGFADYITVNLLFLSVPLFAWSFLYFGYRLAADLNAEKTKYQTTLLQAKEAELHMLRYQINPHFLFNSLNSIQALMYRNTAQADEMLTEFSEFLRYTLENKDDVYVSLGHEIEMVSKYLYIEKIRYQEKLSYTIDVSENTRDIKVLSFLLQPLIENALKHGSKTAEGILRIHVKTLKANGHLLIRIMNSGPWRNQEEGKGIGIENVRKRLENAYPFNHSLSIQEKEDRVVVEIKLFP